MALEARTIDDEIAADWAAIREKHAIEEPEPAEPAQVIEEPTAAECARDEAGRFAKEAKDAEPKSAERAGSGDAAKPAGRNAQALAAPAEPAAAAAAADPAQPAERDITRAPSTWKPTARADWEKLTPAVRTEIHRRESDFMNGQSQLLPDAKFGKGVRDVVEPYRMLIEAEGGTPERAIADLMRTAAIFRVGTPQQKTQALGQIAQQFGVDLRSLVPQIGANQQGQQPQQNQQQPMQDPRVDQLLAQLNAERQQRAHAEQSTLEGSVSGWMNEKDAGGNPARPYLGDVMNEMAALVPQIRSNNPALSHADVLQQAYDRATWGNPEIRALLMQAQNSGQTRASENQNRVREARRAASVNVPRRASIPSPGKPGSIDETITNTARELGLIT